MPIFALNHRYVYRNHGVQGFCDAYENLDAFRYLILFQIKTPSMPAQIPHKKKAKTHPTRANVYALTFLIPAPASLVPSVVLPTLGFVVEVFEVSVALPLEVVVASGGKRVDMEGVALDGTVSSMVKL
jgi:hypothetical protein